MRQMISHSKRNKLAIGTRIAAAELAKVDAIIQETGQSRAEWLNQLIKEALGHDVPTVRSMAARLAMLETRLAMLGKQLTG